MREARAGEGGESESERRVHERGVGSRLNFWNSRRPRNSSALIFLDMNQHAFGLAIRDSVDVYV